VDVFDLMAVEEAEALILAKELRPKK